MVDSLEKTDMPKQIMADGWNPVASCTNRPTNGAGLPAMCSPPCAVLSESDGEKQYRLALQVCISRMSANNAHLTGARECLQPVVADAANESRTGTTNVEDRAETSGRVRLLNCI